MSMRTSDPHEQAIIDQTRRISKAGRARVKFMRESKTTVQLRVKAGKPIKYAAASTAWKSMNEDARLTGHCGGIVFESDIGADD